jgi:hypothetical protein
VDWSSREVSQHFWEVAQVTQTITPAMVGVFTTVAICSPVKQPQTPLPDPDVYN